MINSALFNKIYNTCYPWKNTIPNVTSKYIIKNSIIYELKIYLIYKFNNKFEFKEC